MPWSRIVTSIVRTMPPPAESPARIMVVGSCFSSRRYRYAARPVGCGC
ncbi:hypothetical protein GMOD_00002465 [Pyrenophora seminiperda CCB06]|uniref:Uncharacterized protein n=1 Tax=Pyrenophora seminiperda CCB06 TaxID=1302712 RepID=A0A3M7M2C4_9PLEO|nr:hypothetical protein GMOD_00002465 [Pyrenophora seminiperda CCB06]